MLKYLISLLIVSNLCSAQTMQKFEPADGRVIHGLGQYEGFFYNDESIWQDIKDYETAVENAPLIYSVYASIDPLNMQFDPTDFNDIVSNHDYPYLLLVGILYHDSQYLTSGTFNVHVESILNGSLDTSIVALANRIKNIAAPVFVRPGFEFGVNNSGFHNDPDMGATEFKNIWIHIHNLFSEHQVTNVAWVWNTVNPGAFNYLDWYPGDQYVDWWGINYFTSGQISGADGFINDAKVHDKPVMVCESSPITSNGTLNTNNWNSWFLPYFNKIKSNEQIKAFVYINSPWTIGPFSDWPESRITENATISENYRQQLADSIFINMDEYLLNPAIISSIKQPDNIPFTPDLKFNNYPNPFNSQTNISWKSIFHESVKINIFNILGEKVAFFNIADTKPGINEIVWNAHYLPSGIYYAQIKTGRSNLVSYIKMSLIK